VHAPFIHAYRWLSAQTLGVSKYDDKMFRALIQQYDENDKPNPVELMCDGF
jgi:hypothetical protein